MTTLEASPRWFPVAAIPTLLATLSLAFLSERMVRAWEQFRYPKFEEQLPLTGLSIAPTSDHLIQGPATTISSTVRPLLQQPPHPSIKMSSNGAPVSKLDKNEKPPVSIEASLAPDVGRWAEIGGRSRHDETTSPNPRIRTGEEAIQISRPPHQETGLPRPTAMNLLQRASFAVTDENRDSRQRAIKEHSSLGARSGPSSYLSHFK
jgi:hypothetical protein